MLVERDIYASYKSQVEAATKEQAEALMAEVEALRLWGERWGVDAEDTPTRMQKIPMLFEDENGIYEARVDRVVCDLESANKSMLRQLDSRIVEAYRAMRKVGFRRPSSVLYGTMFLKMTGEGGLDKYVDNTSQLRGVRLVMQRLRSTCRIAFRFENEKYHRTVVENEDGTTDIFYGKERWAEELRARQVMKGKD